MITILVELFQSLFFTSAFAQDWCTTTKVPGTISRLSIVYHLPFLLCKVRQLNRQSVVLITPRSVALLLFLNLGIEGLLHNQEDAGIDIQIVNCLPFTISRVQGPLAQSVERGADNAKVVSSILTRTREYSFVSIKPSEQKTNLLLTFHFIQVSVFNLMITFQNVLAC